MKYDTYIPSDILKPYIRAFVISENDAEDSYKVFPETGVVIGFQYRGRLARIENEKITRLDTAGISGLNSSFRIFTNTAGIGSVLVMFKEAGASNFFRQPLHELFGKSISLDNFILRSELMVLEEKLCEAKTDIARIRLTEGFLISRLNDGKPDTMVMAALEYIHEAKGEIRITDLMQELNISQSPLEKRFRQIIGASPKKYASIVRMKNAIEIHNPANSLTELGYEAGFYDQAHFIKEFKNFTGSTPENFFKNK